MAGSQIVTVACIGAWSLPRRRASQGISPLAGRANAWLKVFRERHGTTTCHLDASINLPFAFGCYDGGLFHGWARGLDPVALARGFLRAVLMPGRAAANGRGV